MLKPAVFHPITAAATALALVYLLGFLAVHEVEHVGEAHAEHCVYAPLACATAGAVLPAALALPLPVVVRASPPPSLVDAPQAPAPHPQSRGPPRA